MPNTEMHAFHRCGSQLLRLEETQWNAFCTGNAPWAAVDPVAVAGAPIRGRIDVLLITLRDGECVLAEPLSLRLDNHGYLLRMYLPLESLPARSGLLDARLPFIKRYLRHAHHWVPTAEQLADAISNSAAPHRATLGR